MGTTFSGTLITTQTLTNSSFATINPVVVANTATISVANSSAIYGQAGGTVPASGWTIFNEGTVSGNLFGISLDSSGLIFNGSTNSHARVTGSGTGILISGSNGTLDNSGAVVGQDENGIQLSQGGLVFNNAGGNIQGKSAGVEVDNKPGTVDNYGVISASTSGSSGVQLNGGGYVSNASSGTIKASNTAGIGVNVVGPNGTVVDNGVISGSTAATNGFAVVFTSGTNLMEVQPSASIVGTIAGGTAAGSDNILEFASGDNVTLSGLKPGVVSPGTTIGTTGTFSDSQNPSGVVFENFGDINVDQGATVTLTGTNTFGPGSGLLVSGGGTVSNTGTVTANPTISDSTLVNTGTIIGAVYGINSPNTLYNTGTITNSSSTVAAGEAVSFSSGGYIDNGDAVIVTVTSTSTSTVTSTNFAATIAGYNSGADIEGAPGTVTNLGTITATSTTNGIGVWLSAGGTVNNGVDATGSTVNTSALIQAYDFGVLISGGVGVVNNDATISGNGDSAGVILLNGGTVTNGSTTDNTALIVGENFGVVILGGPGTVTNFCTIIADSTTGGDGVVIASGTVKNGWSGDTAASITADSVGVWSQGSAFIDNYGTILGTDKTTSLGAFVQGPGTIINGFFTKPGTADTTALISGASFGVADDGNTSVKNFGTIEASGTEGVGLNVRYGNADISNGLFTVVNSSTTYSSNVALIEGSRAGIAVASGNMTLNNQGTVIANATYGYGAVFGNGTVTNGASGNRAAYIKGHFGLLASGNLTLNNWGTVSGDPAGGSGVQVIGSVSITNAGTSASIVGGSFGVDAGGSGSILNLGTIAGYYYKGSNGAGIDVGANSAGSSLILTNGSSNTGTIITSSVIEGPQFGVVDFGSGTVTNWGTIRAGTTIGPKSNPSGGTLEQGAAVVMFNGTVVNGGIESGAAVIQGESVGIFSPGPATITDYGTIFGGVDAISLVSGNNIVSLAGTSAAIGNVGYGNGGSIVGGTFPGSTNKLEFGQGASVEIQYLTPAAFSGASTGVLETQNDADYATFSNFGTIQVDAAGTLVFEHYNTIPSATTLAVGAGGYALVSAYSGYLLNKGSITIAPGGTFQVDDFGTLVNAHTIAGDVTLEAGGVLTNTATGTITGDAAVYVSGLGTSGLLPTVVHHLNAPLDPHLLGAGGLGFYAYVTNASGGVINGGSGQSIGVEDDSPLGFALLNSGTVTGGKYGVDLAGASNSGYGIVVNGLQFPSAGPVFVPDAVISGGAAGVYASAPGLYGRGPIVLNAGTIVGSYGIGVDLTNGGIVVDSGAIIGNDGTAVAFGPDNFSALYLAPGYKLLGPGGTPGAVVTSNPFNSTLVLGSGSFAGLHNAVGTISGIGVDGPGRFVFGNVYVAGYPSPAVWSIVGANTIGSGYTLSGNPSQTGVLVFAPNATLDIQGQMEQGNFFKTSDGEKGVDLNLNGPGAQELILGQQVASYDYRDTSGRYYIAQGDTFFGTIEGVGAGDTIEIGGVSLGSSPVASYNTFSHQLTITSSNGTDYTFTDIHAQGVSHFVVSTDPVNGDVKLVADPGPSVGTAGTISAGTVLSDPTSLDLPLNALVTPGVIGDAETITGFSTFTAHGTVSSDGHGGLIYTPTALASGADSFTFTATDQYGDTTTGTVDLTLNATAAVAFAGTGGSTINVGANNAAVSLSGNLNTVGGISSNGVVTVTGASSGNTVTLGNGNDTVNLTGFSNSISLGSGNNIVTLAGAGGTNSVTVGAGADVITDTNSGTGDTFNLNGSNAFLAVSGGGALAFISGGNDQISLSGSAATSSTIKVGASGGNAEVIGFGAGDTVDLAGGLGFASAADVLAYANNPANSDGHGGTLLHYNGGAIDFVGLTPGHFSASNFSVA
jgi:fibronectin-binding autotransporter adhesin